MLRMLQVEVNQRTDAHEKRVAAAGAQATDAERAEFNRESDELAAEQRRLAELVQEILTRNNKQDEQ